MEACNGMIRCTNLRLTFNHGLPTQRKALDGLTLDIPGGGSL